MKFLIIIYSHSFDVKWYENIRILNDYAKSLDMEVEYCGISNQDDFHNYESIIQYKYKIINTKRQFSKLSDFITDYKSELHYDWYMSIRPDIKLLENINFGMMSENAINSRARVYYGPQRIKYGMSVNGPGPWINIGHCGYQEKETEVIVDSMLYIFHKNIIELNAFDKIESEEPGGCEWKQTYRFNERKIPINLVGINLVNTKCNAYSGDINM